MNFKDFLKESLYKHIEVSYKRINHPDFPYAVFVKGKSGPVAFFKRNYDILEIYNKNHEYKGCCKHEKYLNRFVRSGKLDSNIYYIKRKIEHSKFTHAIFLRDGSENAIVYTKNEGNKYLIYSIESEKEIESFSKFIDAIRYIHEKLKNKESL